LKEVMKKVIVAFVVFLLLSFVVPVPFSSAQVVESTNIGMADTLRSEGKIYVVVLVVVIVFTGLIIYAVNTERKLTKIEKEMQSLKSPKDS